MTAEEFTTSVAEAIAAQLKIDASALITRLVDSLSKGLIKEFTKKGPLLAEKPKTAETAKQKAETAKLPKIEISLPKILENQFSKLDDISKSLNKLANKKDVVIDNKTQKPAESSFGVLGNTLQKILQIANKPSEKASVNLIDSKVSKSQEPSEKSSFGVLGNTLQKILGSFRAPSEPTKAPEIIKPLVEIVTKEAPKSTSAVPPKVEAPKSLLEEKVEAKPVIIAGISESGLKDLSEHLPDIIKQGVNGLIDQLKDSKEKKKEDKKGGEGLLGMLPTGLLTTLGLAGGGIALLLGGVAALVTGLMTDGPFKGLLKIVSRVGIAGGLKLLEKGAGMFLKNLNNFIKAPIKLLAGVAKSIGGLFGAEGAKAALKTVASGKGIFGTMLKGISTFLKGAVKKLPVIGSVISIGFAVSRFLKGDVVGGTIDMLSAVASLVPFVGMPIAIGLDVLNAILDAKTGGASPEASQKKTGILKEWAKAIGEKMYAGLIDAPVFGPMIKAGKHLYAKEWMQGLKQIAYIVPGFEFVGALLGDTETTGGMQQLAEGYKNVGKSAINWISEMSSWLIEKSRDLPFFGTLIKAGELFSKKDWAKGLVQLSRAVPGVGWLYDMMGVTEEKQEAIITNELNIVKDLFEWIKTSIWDKVKGIVGGTVDTVKGWWSEAVNFVTGEDETPVKPVAPVKQVGDAKVKPDGGLVVSSPTEGSLFQTSKNDIIEENTSSSKPGSIFQLNKDSGITAGPVTDDASAPGGSSSIASTAANIGNSDKILTKIAINTETTNKSIAGLANGFNVLAKSLERLGVSVANQSPTVINNVSGGSKGGSPKISSTQIASAGNSAISSFRSGIEASRFVPA